MPAVYGRRIEVGAPLLRLGVEFVQVVDRFELQLRLELALDDVPGVLDRARNPRRAWRVHDDLDAQGAAEVLRHRRDVGRTRVHHQDAWHAVEHVGSTTLLHGLDQHRAEVLATLGAHHIANVDPAGVVIGDLVGPHTVSGHAIQVRWLVLVELLAIHHL